MPLIIEAILVGIGTFVLVQLLGPVCGMALAILLWVADYYLCGDSPDET